MHRRGFLQASAGVAALGLPAFARANSAEVTLNGALALVSVQIASIQPALFLLDTGASVTAVDGSLAGAVGMDRFLPKSGPLLAPPTAITVAGRTGLVRPAMADFKSIASALGSPVLGLLGNDFLSGFKVVVSYPERRLSLAESSSRPTSAHPLRFSGMPFVRASVRTGGNALEGEFGLDTGLDTGAKLLEAKARRAFPGLATTEGQGLSMLGAKPYALATAEIIRAGGWDVPNLPMFLSDAAPPQGAGPDYAGTLGAALFAGRVLTVDYPGGWWSLSPAIR